MVRKGLQRLTDVVCRQWRSQGSSWDWSHLKKQIIESWLLWFQKSNHLFLLLWLKWLSISKIKNMTGSPYQHTQQNCFRDSTPQTSSRPQEQNQQPPRDQQVQLVPCRQIYLHSIHIWWRWGYSLEMWFVPIQLLRWNWEWFRTRTQIIIFQRGYLSFTLASGTYHFGRGYFGIGSASWVLTDAAPTPIPIPRMRFDGGKPWENPRKVEIRIALDQNPFQLDRRIHAWVRCDQELMSSRERLGVTLCRANKESVCSCVCRDVFRKKMMSNLFEIH